MKAMKATFCIALLVFVARGHCDTHSFLPSDCDDIYRHNNTSSSGVYTIYPGGPTTPLHVYCDMHTDGGRWTVFQRRMDGSENFLRPWKNYKTGFGNVAGEYWLGLDNIFYLTIRKENELRVDMEDWDGRTASAWYSSFSIESENGGYQLHLGTYIGGEAGDSLVHHNQMKFTTYDKDQDLWTKNCAQHYLGGFWYNQCHHVNINGIYMPPEHSVLDSTYAMWNSWKGKASLKTVAMKIRSAAKCSCTR